MWTWSLAEATAVLNSHSGCRSVTPVPDNIPSHIITDFIFSYVAPLINIMHLKLEFCEAGWADWTASCHQEGQVSPSSSPFANSGHQHRPKQNKMIKNWDLCQVEVLHFLWRGQIQRPKDGDSMPKTPRLQTEERTVHCTSKPRGRSQLIRLQSCPERRATVPNCPSSAASAPFLWAGLVSSEQIQLAAWPSSPGGTRVAWAWQPRAGLAGFSRDWLGD